MKKIHKERLLKLAKFLREKVAPLDHNRDGALGLYQQGVWLGDDSKGHHHSKASLNCRTPACAMGWATAIFPLHMNGRGEIVITGNHNDDTTGDTIEKFFGVTSGMVQYRLFNSSESRTAVEEADLIEQYVKENE